MNVAQLLSNGKAENLLDMAGQLQQFVQQAADEGKPLNETEKNI